MRKKRVYIVVVVTVVLLLLAYFGYYFLFLKEEGQNWKSSNDIDLDDSNSVELVITDVKENEIKYCVVNDCTYTLLIPPTATIEMKNFDGLGEYQITFNFSKYPLYPWSKYTYLKSWSIEKVENEQTNFTVDSYLESVKQLFKNYYIWEIYSLPTTPTLSREDASFIHENPVLDWDYTKSLYLIYQISQSSSDEELQQVFEKEITYLNDNAEKIIENYEDYSVPSAHLLKLIDQGLSIHYLSLIDNAEIPQYSKEVLEQIVNDKIGRPIESGNPYSLDYKRMIRYVDDYKIFNEYGETDLADFSYNQMIVLFNSMESLNGVCTLAYSTEGLIDSNELKDKLEGVFNNETTELIEGGIYELAMCKKYVKVNNMEIKDLDQAIHNALNMSTSKVEEYFFIMRGVSTLEDNVEELPTIKSFSLLDNLMYIWSET
jgi:hypothetical protein